MPNKIEFTKEYLFKEYLENGKNLRQISLELGYLSSNPVSQKAKEWGLPLRPARIDFTGQRFGKITVLEFFGHTESKNGCIWTCKCDCGKIFNTMSSRLSKSDCKSCGCTSKESFSEKVTKWHKFGEIPGRAWMKIFHNAKVRDLQLEIDIVYLNDLYIKQNKKCALSKLDIGFGNIWTASLDRIDSSKGYIKDNVQWVHKDVNKMKNIFPTDYLIKLCGLIYENSKNESNDAPDNGY